MSDGTASHPMGRAGDLSPRGDSLGVSAAMSRITRTVLQLALTSALAAAAVCCQGAPAVRRPETHTGPYRVVVERVTQTQYLQSMLRPAPGITGRRSAHVQLRVLADNPEAALALEIFAVNALTVDADGRRTEVAHYGGPLENADDAVLRAYAYASDVGLSTTRLSAITGEITAFERARVQSVDLPLDGLPLTKEVDGLVYTLLRASAKDGDATVELRVKAPAGSNLVAATTDGAYGIQLLCAGVEAPAAAGSSMAGSARDGAMTFTLNYHSLTGAAPLAGARLRVPLLIRSGQRRVYPFQLENIPLPGRG